MNSNEYAFVCAGIRSGAFVTLPEAAKRLSLPYWTARRRIHREGVPTIRLHGRLYLSVTELSRPALRVR
jgi:hypothetical protein